MKDEYKEAVIYTYPNATIRLYSPILAEEERAKRMKNIHKEAVNLLRKVKE